MTVSMPDSRIRSRTSSRAGAKAKVMPWFCSSLIKFSRASQPLASIKFTESASTSTYFAGGWLAASAVFSPSSTFDTRKEELTSRAPNQQPGEDLMVPPLPAPSRLSKTMQTLHHPLLELDELDMQRPSPAGILFVSAYLWLWVPHFRH